MRRKYEFAHIMIRPYGANDALSDEFPGFEHFDDRSDFKLHDTISHIAVMLDIRNREYQEPGTGGTHKFTVSLYDRTRQRTATSADFVVRLSPWKMAESVRVDLPVTYETLDTGHEYYIHVRRSVSDRIIERFRVGFFDPYDDYSTLLSKPSKAYLTAHGYWSDEIKLYRSVSYDSYTSYALDVEFTSVMADIDSLPEPYIDLYSPEGKRHTISGIYLRDRCSDNCNDTTGSSGTKCVARFWLNDHIGSNDRPYYAEFSILGNTLGGIVFAFNTDDEGFYTADQLSAVSKYDPMLINSIFEHRKAANDKEAAEARQKLQSLVGLDGVKDKVRLYESMARFYKLRQNVGFNDTMPALHSMFLGAPGTGKTTVAKIIGKLLNAAGVLSKGHVVVRERSTLLGQYYNSESNNTLSALEEAQGGVLFIDEAYQLFQSQDPKDPGKFVIETLMTALADESNRDWMLILAGYTAPMKRLFDINPGLRSRIPDNNLIYFEDYSPEQLYSIADSYISDNGYRLDDDADTALKALLKHDYDNRMEDFGNARHVINVIQHGILPSMAERVTRLAKPTVDDLTTIRLTDVPKPSLRVMPYSSCSRKVGFVK